MPGRKWWSCLVAILVVASLGAATGHQPGEAAAAETSSAAPTHATAVTLVTGDRVLATRAPGGGYAVEVRPAPGRERMLFEKIAVGDRQLVLPLDAAPLVASGVLDERLFDVALLIRFGFDDATSPTVPLLLQYGGGRTARAARSALPTGTRVVRDLPLVDAVAATPAKRSLGALWRDWSAGPDARAALPTGVRRVWLDGGFRPTLDRSVPQIGAPAAWHAGYTGRGVKVAVLDTGYDPTHPDLAGAVVDAANFTTDPDVVDHVGHGTHVASIITGSGVASGGRYEGVAPDAQLLVGKVCEVRGCAISSIIAGMQWATEHGARVVNMSLGGGPTDGTDPLSQAIDELTAQTGTLFVVSAGNLGESGAQTVTSPAAADEAFAVGSVTKADTLSAFSSRGPRFGDHALKPDITAPGSRIVAARARGTLDQFAVSPYYAELSGTSMAAPHVAGAAAIVAQQHPGWHAHRLEAALTGSAHPLAGLGVYAQGAGRVDVARAVRQQVTTTPDSLDLGVAAWPHRDDEPIRRVVRYHNDGRHAVTLRLRLDVTGPRGRRAPRHLVTLSRDTVRVPAGGSASVAVLARTSLDVPDGDYAGWLVARDHRGDRVRTSLGVFKQPASYTETITMLDRNGQPAGATDDEVAFAVLVDIDSGQVYFPPLRGGTGAVTVPAGTYALDALVGTLWPDGNSGYREALMFPEPTLVVDGDDHIVLDGRRANRVETVPPVAGASATVVGVGYVRPVGDGAFVAGVAALHPIVREAMPQVYVTPNRTGSRRDFTGFAQVMWAKMPPNPSAFQHFWLDSPYLYHDLATWPGRIPDHPVLATPRRGYAHVRAAYATSMPDRYANKYGFPYLPVPGGRGGLAGAYVFVSTVEMSLPFRRDEFYSVDGGYRWAFGFQEYRYVGEDSVGEIVTEQTLDSGLTDYRAGRTYRERWNAAVFAPRLPQPQVGYTADLMGSPWAFRDGDTLSLAVPAFGDAGSRRSGDALHETEFTALYAHGRRIASSAAPYLQTFRVPARRQRYTLTKQVTRPSGTYPLSTRVESTWTFASKRVEDGTERPLPLLTVGYAPALDLHNVAPGGGTFRLPVTVERQYGSGRGRVHVRSLTLEVSYDDGGHWRQVPVRRSGGGDGGGWVATLRHPDSGFVSLRAGAVDTEDNRVRQTVIRAYRIG